MVNQIMKLSALNSSHAKALTDALKASGYDEAGKAAIQEAIDANLHVATAASKSSVMWLVVFCVLLSFCSCLSLPLHLADLGRRSTALSIPRQLVASVLFGATQTRMLPRGRG